MQAPFDLPSGNADLIDLHAYLSLADYEMGTRALLTAATDASALCRSNSSGKGALNGSQTASNATMSCA